MHVLGAVQAESDRKTFRRQKTAPGIVEEGAVGLHAVGHRPSGGPMFALERYDLAKSVEAVDKVAPRHARKIGSPRRKRPRCAGRCISPGALPTYATHLPWNKGLLSPDNSSTSISGCRPPRPAWQKLEMCGKFRPRVSTESRSSPDHRGPHGRRTIIIQDHFKKRRHCLSRVHLNFFCLEFEVLLPEGEAVDSVQTVA